MKNFVTGFTLLALASFALVGCNKDNGGAAKSAAAPKKIISFGDPKTVKVQDLLPKTKGTQATYEVVGNPGNDLTIRVKDYQENGGMPRLTLEFLEGNKVTDVSEWEFREKGLYQLSARKGKPYNPPTLQISSDLTDRKEYSFKGTGPYPSVEAGKPDTGPMESLTKIRGVETVDTSMGQIEALAVITATIYTSDGKKYRQMNTTWFAPKYGIVRYVQNLQREDGQSSSFTLKLKGFSAK
ncbi:MAG: hypothetical protein KF824_06390 [Fimbriimonadaceae bacterium]|nr:MAG: hypothetical protein KF824_06390 [Fimbriimonadaceae bacterium]